jgi:hypothetical protein
MQGCYILLVKCNKGYINYVVWFLFQAYAYKKLAEKVVAFLQK